MYGGGDDEHIYYTIEVLSIRKFDVFTDRHAHTHPP